MKHIVTGGAGFIGSNLVDELIKQGHEVVVLDDFSTGKKENLNPLASFFEFDLSIPLSQWPTKIKEVFKGSDSIFHLAALARVQPSIDDPILYNTANVDVTLNLLKMANDSKVRRFIFSASSSAYGEPKELPTKETEETNPLSPYGLQKMIGEQYCKLFAEIYNIETVSLRYFNVFGERMNLDGGYRLVMPIFASQIIEGKPMTVRGDGDQKRDFIYVKDVVQANILASKSQNVGNGEIINIGYGESISINSIARAFGGKIKYVTPLLEPRNTLADNTLAQKLLNWSPTTTVEEWIPKYKKQLGL